MLSRFQVTFVVGDEYNRFSVRGDVGEPGVTGFVKGHLGLFGAVCLHAPDLHESGAYGIEPDVLSAGGIFRSVIQTFGSVRKNANIAVRKGIQYIQFTRRPESDAKAIDKYLSSLRAVESPHIKNGELSDAALRGQVVFEEAKCSVCHTGKYYTDMKRHDVGSGLEEYKGFAFDTPTLCEVWRTAPYLYDGG